MLYTYFLNLIIKDELIKDAIKKICDSVAFWFASPSRLEKFEEVVHKQK